MSDIDDPDDFYQFLDNWEEFFEQLDRYKKFKAQFSEDLISRITSTTYQYFTAEPPHPDLRREEPIDKAELRKKIASHRNFEFYGIFIFESLEQCMVDFQAEEIPPDRKLFTNKIHYRTRTDEEIEERIKELIEIHNFEFSQEDMEKIRHQMKEEALVNKYYDNFEIAIHNTLKKMAVDYFPEIMDITATGFREINYLLYLNMTEIIQDLYGILGIE